jgi:heme/copper-type cytochrome/quinol oxidase subunit 2
METSVCSLKPQPACPNTTVCSTPPQTTTVAVTETVKTTTAVKVSILDGINWFQIFIWIIIIGFIVWFILYLLRPIWVQKRDHDGNHTGEIDHTRLFIAAVLITLGIFLLIFLFKQMSF